jgi:trans-o-hydroxybenzylidenepyruvate hydratase-aldolase
MAITAQDISGVYVMAPTPCVEGGEHWSNANSVDLDETARMVENLIRDGVAGLALCGTTGECAALLWDEKQAFIDTALQVARHRVPIFAGATSLGTKETVRQMRAYKDMGAEAAFVGLPLWQTPTIANSVRWFADLSEATPELGIMVYSNAMFFKSRFPREFWEGVAKDAPRVITNKITSPAIMEDLEKIVENTGDRISYLPIDNAAMNAWERVGNKIKGMWSTNASMGPEPVVALSKAINANDEARIKEIVADLRSVAPGHPQKESGEESDPFTSEFPMYNAQQEKARFNAAGYIKCGPSRAPYLYDDMPQRWKDAATANGKSWSEMRKKYMKAPVK